MSELNLPRRQLAKQLLGLAATGTVLGLTTAQAATPVATTVASASKVLKPGALRPGDTVGLVSPSAATADSLDFQLVNRAMQALGLQVKTGRFIANRRGHLAGTDAERAQDLNTMFADPEVKAVICLRGGSGAARILPLLDYAMIAANPKPLLGYSDITALHCALQAKTGLISFHGPNGSDGWPAFNVRQFQQLFFDKSLPLYQNEAEQKDELVPRNSQTLTIQGGVAEGRLVGGNLTVLTALSGTPYFPDCRDKILFIEDIAEAPYRIDRMLSTLALNGTLQQIKGLVFGECTDCTPENGYGNLTLDQILQDYLLPLNIPVYRGAMIGHLKRQFILPVGGKVRLDATAGTLQLLEPVFAG